MSSKKKAATAQKPATTTKPATVTKPATAAITAETFEPNDPSAGCDYEDVDRTKIAFVEIFPPIGVTRVGDSGTFNGIRKKLRPIEYFYTPEVPNHFDGPEGGFRDKHARIRRQVTLIYSSITIFQALNLQYLRPLASAYTHTMPMVKF